MRQLLVREQCLQREQKLAHSNKQQLPSSLTVPKSGHHNSKHEMATTTIAITRAAASNSAPRQWQPPTPPPHPPPPATTPVVTSSSSLPPLSNSRHPKSAKGNSPATVAETNQVLRLKNPTTYHVLQSQKRRQELLTSNAVASSGSCYDQNACRGDVVATASTTRNPEAVVAGVEAHVGHKHLLYPPKTTTTSAFMTRSAPEILPGEGMSPTSSGLLPLPPAAETISSVASATSAASAASAAALAASASCALPTHFSSSAPEPNQVQSQRKNKSDCTASASSAAAPKGINYSCGSHAASPTSIEVRPCHRSFRVSGLEAVPEEAEGGGHKLRNVLVLYSMSQSKISTSGC